jgi:class III poly(R)-hydroxyalkanoic acid synthase PhaE subunit
VSATDPTRAFADFWTAQGKAFLKVQQQASQAFADGMQALAAGEPALKPEVQIDISTAVADLARVGQSVSALLSAATSMLGAFAKTSPFAASNPTVEATFRKMLDPRSWMINTNEVDDVLGRMAEGPRFADLWEIERRYARVLQAWMTVRRTGLEHNAVVLTAWTKAAGDFIEEFSRAANTDADVRLPDAKAAFASWTETANRQLLETQRSDPFLQTQAAMIRASTELRMAQQELVEHFGEQYGFPTRTELDDVHRTVTALRREVRALRRDKQAIAPPDRQVTETHIMRRQIGNERETKNG